MQFLMTSSVSCSHPKFSQDKHNFLSLTLSPLPLVLHQLSDADSYMIIHDKRYVIRDMSLTRCRFPGMELDQS